MEPTLIVVSFIVKNLSCGIHVYPEDPLFNVQSISQMLINVCLHSCKFAMQHLVKVRRDDSSQSLQKYLSALLLGFIIMCIENG